MIIMYSRRYAARFSDWAASTTATVAATAANKQKNTQALPGTHFIRGKMKTSASIKSRFTRSAYLWRLQQLNNCCSAFFLQSSWFCWSARPFWSPDKSWWTWKNSRTHMHTHRAHTHVSHRIASHRINSCFLSCTVLKCAFMVLKRWQNGMRLKKTKENEIKKRETHYSSQQLVIHCKRCRFDLKQNARAKWTGNRKWMHCECAIHIAGASNPFAVSLSLTMQFSYVWLLNQLHEFNESQLKVIIVRDLASIGWP